MSFLFLSLFRITVVFQKACLQIGGSDWLWRISLMPCTLFHDILVGMKLVDVGAYDLWIFRFGNKNDQRAYGINFIQLCCAVTCDNLDHVPGGEVVEEKMNIGLASLQLSIKYSPCCSPVDMAIPIFFEIVLTVASTELSGESSDCREQLEFL
ncbi:hypothetical protein Tco_0608559 [Tanacetum coccineum]